MTAELTIEEVREFIRLQKGLVGILCVSLNTRAAQLVRAAYDEGSSGVVEFASHRWEWKLHGVGISFEGEHGKVVDLYQRVLDPTEVDSWRIVIFREFASHAQAASALARLATEGVLAVASLPGTPLRKRRYRLSEDHFELKWPWVAVGQTGGGWIEFQPGPFKRSHWHEDSLYVGAFDSSVLYPALSSAIPGFDSYAFYKDMQPDTVMRLVQALREHAVSALDAPDEAWWNSVDCPAVGGRRDSRLALRIYDFSWGLADWLEATLHQHETLSILGA